VSSPQSSLVSGPALPPQSSAEDDRIAAVRRYQVLDTPPDGAFDRIARLAATLFDVPIAIVSIVDTDRIWFKSHHGLDVDQTDREPGLCASVILQGDTWIVTDARTDTRTLANPLVAGELGLRFYAGHPLTTSDGYNLGTLCVIDHEPREVTEEEAQLLAELAGMVMEQMELRLQARETISTAEQRFNQIEHLVEALQQSLLPPALPVIPYLELASSYRPASRYEVGGDFYDVFPVDGSSWGFVIGDVCGKGPTAAGRTSGARYSLRAAAIHEPVPSTALDVVNQSMLSDPNIGPEAPFVTALFARVEPHREATRVTFAAAGHPCPVLMRANGEVRVLGTAGTPLGLFDELGLTDCEVTLDPGDTLILITDGVLDSGAPERLEEQGLIRLIASCHDLPIAETVERVRRVSQTSQRDDVAILAIHAERDVRV
jgi:sigma-B regulation protein RsbU (phosphoserine phosphatase)